MHVAVAMEVHAVLLPGLRRLHVGATRPWTPSPSPLSLSPLPGNSTLSFKNSVRASIRHTHLRDTHLRPSFVPFASHLRALDT